MNTVTVKKARQFKDNRVTLHFSKLPGKTFGPYPAPDAVTELTFSALLPRVSARSLVLDALTLGEATTEAGE